MEVFMATGDWVLALGKTIIHSIWVGLLLLSVLKLVLNVIPDSYSNLRYRISVLSLLLLLGSGFALFFLLYSPTHTIKISPGAAVEGPLSLGMLKTYIGNSQLSNYHFIYLISSYIYISGIPVVLIRSMGLFRYQFRMKKAGSPVQNSWKERFIQLKISMGIKRSVELMESGIISAPALVGFFKPVILVPAGMLSNLSVNQVETILMHELFHLRRFDAFANMIQLLIENIFFYNPAVWAISRHIRTEREKCCDDGVLESCGDPLTYARALYQIAGLNAQYAHLAPGAGGTDKFQLLHRIQRILKIDTMKNNVRDKMFSLILLFGGLVIMLTVTGFTSGFSIVKNTDARQMETVTRSFDTIPETPTEVSPIDPLEDEVDWEMIKKEMEEAKIEVKLAMEEIDWEEIKLEMKEAQIEVKKAMEEIDWDEIKLEMKEAKIEAKKAMEEIDWDEIKKEMSDVKLHLDTVFQDIDIDIDDLDVDVDFDNLDMDMDVDFSDLDVDFDFDNMDVDIDFDDLGMAMDSIAPEVVF